MCQRAAIAPPPSPTFLLQILIVPVIDNTATVENNKTWKSSEHVPALPAAKMLWYRRHYLPSEEDWAHPEASPLLWTGDWSKLPEARIVVGGLDILRGEGEQFGKKLTNTGVEAKTFVMEGMPHPFLAMDGALQAGRDAINIMVEGLKTAFG
jgi:acetyl esterase/lipase